MSGKTPENFSNTFFEQELKPWLPDQVLDFHTHIWEPDHWIGYKPGTDLSDNTALAPEALREYQTKDISVRELISRNYLYKNQTPIYGRIRNDVLKVWR